MSGHENCVLYFRDLILDKLPFDCWVAGGALRDFFIDGHCDNSKDIDVFFRYSGEYREACKHLRSLGIKQSFTNDHVTNFDLGFDRHKVQLVGMHQFKGPQETIDKFDFTVCGAAVDKEKAYFLPTFFDDIKERRLSFHALPYPIATLKRLPRYIKKGFDINNDQLLFLADEINQLDEDVVMEHFYENGMTNFEDEGGNHG